MLTLGVLGVKGAYPRSFVSLHFGTRLARLLEQSLGQSSLLLQALSHKAS